LTKEKRPYTLKTDERQEGEKMSATKIKQAALIQFANDGYDGTALASIASAVGIKKQSIYTHFANKDQLFLTVLQEVLDREKKSLATFFQQTEDLKFDEALYQFVNRYNIQYEVNPDTKFLLRMCYLPPSHLYEKVMTSIYKYFDEIEEIMTKFFLNKAKGLSVSIKEAVIAYIGLIDSVLVELLYSGRERFERRLAACWKIYWRGISERVEENRNE